MDFNNRSNLAGQHSFLAPSSPAWLNYDIEKLEKVYATQRATRRADELHELAARLITQRIRLPEVKKTLNLHVNDAIGFRMRAEQVLFYSGNCFGSADAISFRDGILRVHDLKNGLGKTDIRQLLPTQLSSVWSTVTVRSTSQSFFGSIRETRSARKSLIRKTS